MDNVPFAVKMEADLPHAAASQNGHTLMMDNDFKQKLTSIILALVCGTVAMTHLKANDRPAPAVVGEDYTLDLGDGVSLEFVWLDELAVWAGRHEVHNAAFGRHDPEHDSGHWQGHALNGDRQPVVRVNYFRAEKFMAWLAEQPGLAGTGVTPRMPTGEEWDAMAQAGTDRRFPWGDEMPPTRGNYRDAIIEGYEDDFIVTGPVDKVGENEWGLFGVGGNVWEWTSESRQENMRVLRGGSWHIGDEQRLEATFRLDFDPAYNTGVRTGFRVMLEPKPDNP